MVENIYKIVGDRVREERKRAKRTIEQLAERAGLSTSFLSYIEINGRKASLETIRKLAEALQVPVADLFTPTMDPKKGQIEAACQKFARIIQERNSEEVETMLDVVQSVSKIVCKRK